MSDKISFLKESFVFELYPRSSYIQDAATGGCLRIYIFAMCIFNYFTNKMYVIMLVEPVQCWKN